MGLFGKRPATDDSLRATVEELGSTVRSLKLEMTELHDKVYRWMKRTQKRDRDDAAREPEAQPDGEPRLGVSPWAARRLRARRNGGVPQAIPDRE